MTHPFHLAYPVNDLMATKDFYTNILGCKLGRTSSNWMDFDFYGHQLTVHENNAHVSQTPFHKNGHNPFPETHFGVILPLTEWNSLANKLAANNIDFVVEPQVFFEGEAGEQNIMILKDPSGYYIEFKSFASSDRIFKTS